MIAATRHIGLVVRDLDASLVFYRDILGLSIVKRLKESGTYIERVVDIPGAVLEWAKLRAADNSVIELIHYHSGSGSPQKRDNTSSDRLGCSHVAFTVADIELLHAILTEKGYHCNSAPQLSPDGLVKVMYCHDPDGVILEFVEEQQKKWRQKRFDIGT